MARPWIEHWTPDDDEFWMRTGRSIARRNLAFSVFAEFIGFSVWVLWSIAAARLNLAGFHFTTSQLFTIAATPVLVGSTLRFPYTLAVGRFGGRNWTVASALMLLIPVTLLAVMVRHPELPFWAFMLAAGTAGLGGGNFASSMANISFFYPDKRKGFALGLNAAGGNLGVAVAQIIVPLVIAYRLVGPAGSAPHRTLFLENAGLIWIPLILLAALFAWTFMDNLKVSRSPFRAQAAVLRRKHTWVMSLLYVGTFGSFIGYSTGLPLLMKVEFPKTTIALAFLGPLVGSLSRPIGGWLADRLGGARVTFATFFAMAGCVFGVMFFLHHKDESWAFGGFLGTFVLLFLLAGIGNGSTYRMIPMIFRKIHLDAGGAEAPALLAARLESAAAVGFIGAIGAYGGWLVPQGFGLSTSITGSPLGALWFFVAFYGACLTLSWWYYLRRSIATGWAPSFAGARV